MDTESTIFVESKWFRVYNEEVPHYLQAECLRDVNVNAPIMQVRTILLRNIFGLTKTLDPLEQRTVINMVNECHVSEMESVLRNYVVNKLIGASHGR